MLTLLLTLTYHVSQSCHFKTLTLTLTLAHRPTPGNASKYIENNLENHWLKFQPQIILLMLMHCHVAKQKNDQH